MKNVIWILLCVLSVGCTNQQTNTAGHRRGGTRSRPGGPDLDRQYTWGAEVVPGGHVKD
jgi:hypothetical protein